MIEDVSLGAVLEPSTLLALLTWPTSVVQLTILCLRSVKESMFLQRGTAGVRL